MGIRNANECVGIWAIPGYTLRGIEKELGNLRGSGTYRYIESTRSLQGQREYEESTQEQRDAMVDAWKKIPANKKKGGTFFNRNH